MDGHEAWDRQLSETSLGYALFAEYRDLGPLERSLGRVARDAGRSLGSVQQLSRRNSWLARAEAFDSENDRQRRALQAREREQMARRQVLAGQLLMSKAVKRAQTMTDEEVALLSVWEMVRMLEAGVRLERMGRGHKRCRPGDLVINTMWAWMGALGVSRHYGIVSPAYGVYRPLREAGLLSDYADLLLRTTPYVAEYTCRSTGIQASRLRLYPEQFLRVGLACPPLPEQVGIVRFLAHVDRRIGRYVRAKQQLIALLAEQRGARVREAVRSDGTQTLRLEVVADRIQRLIDRRDDDVYTPVGLFNRGRGIFHKQATRGAELGDSTFFWVEAGDLVLSGQFAWEGAIALAGDVDAGCVATHRYPILRGKPNLVDSGYLLAFLKTGLGQLLLDHHSRGAAGRNRPLNVHTLMKESIPIPSLRLQREIAALVHLEAQMYRAVSETAQALRDYRARLITDVVTGRIDVREAAARLPDEVEEPEPLGELASLFDVDDDAGDDLEGASEHAET